MKFRRLRKPCGFSTLVTFAIFMASTTSPGMVFGAEGSEVRKTAEKTVEIGISAQTTHEEWVDEQHQLNEEIDSLRKRIEHVQWQRQRQKTYTIDIEEKIQDLEVKAAAMEAVNNQLLPILEENMVKLDQHINTDVPFLSTERRKSVIQAKGVLNDYDLSLLDKTRAVLDAAAREVDLGHRVAVSEDDIEIEGTVRRVKMLMVGRVGLYAMTLDAENAFAYDSSTDTWKSIQENSSAVHEAIDMAEGIRLIGLSKLPLPQPVALSNENGGQQ